MSFQTVSRYRRLSFHISQKLQSDLCGKSEAVTAVSHVFDNGPPER